MLAAHCETQISIVFGRRGNDIVKVAFVLRAYALWGATRNVALFLGFLVAVRFTQ